MLNEMLGKFHFWVTFLGAYAIYFPMHYIGLLVCRAGISRWRYGFRSAIGHDAEYLHHHGGIDRGLRPDGVLST